MPLSYMHNLYIGWISTRLEKNSGPRHYFQIASEIIARVFLTMVLFCRQSIEWLISVSVG